MIGAGLAILAFLAKAKAWPWKLIGKVALVVAAVVGLWLLGRSIYSAGYKEADDHWKATFAAMERRAERAELQRDNAISQLNARAQLRRAQLALESTRGRNEILAATPANETPIAPELVHAWRNSIDRLCVFPGPSGTLSDSCSAGTPG